MWRRPSPSPRAKRSASTWAARAVLEASREAVACRLRPPSSQAAPNSRPARGLVCLRMRMGLLAVGQMKGVCDGG